MSNSRHLAAAILEAKMKIKPKIEQIIMGGFSNDLSLSHLLGSKHRVPRILAPAIREFERKKI